MFIVNFVSNGQIIFQNGYSQTAYDGFCGAMYLSTLDIVSLFSFSHSGRFNWHLIVGWSIFFLISDPCWFFFFFFFDGIF